MASSIHAHLAHTGMHLLTFRRLGASALLATAWLAAACLGVPVAAQAQPVAVPPAPAASAAAPAAPAVPAPVPAASGAALDQRVQDLKSEVINLNRDLLVLEEELLYPASTQVAVFVSMDVGKLFSLESVEIKFDEKTVAHYLYTPAEVAALHRGGVQRLYVGNLRAGAHEITAFFTGQGPHTRDYKRATTLKFDKGGEPKYIELQIKDATANLQPQFEVKVW